MDGRRTCTRGLPLACVLALACACSDLGVGRGADLTPTPSGPALAAVTAVTIADDGRLTVRFSRQMAPDATSAAVRLLRLSNHLGNDLAQGTEALALQPTWQDSRTLLLDWAAAAGSYVLYIGAEARTAAGAPLDGLRPGVVAGVHRPDDDWLDAPADYISQTIQLGSGVPRFVGIPPNSYLLLTDVTAFRADSPSLPRNQEPTPMWRYGQSRVALAPPHTSNLALRLQFASPAGFPYNLVEPGSMVRAVKVMRSDGAEFNGRVDLSNNPSGQFPLTTAPKITSVAGLVVTLASGPAGTLATLRQPQDTLWLLLGGQLPPRGLLALVANYVGIDTPTVTLSDMATPVNGTVWGVTVSTQATWPQGALAGGFSLDINGTEYAVETATDQTIWLRDPAPPGPCADCTLLLRRAEERAFVDEPAFFTSDVWYYFPQDDLPSGQRLLLSVNEDGLLRSLPRRAFRDLERDGDESVVPAVAEDEQMIAFSLRRRIDVPFDASRINDGTFYDTVFAVLDFDCRGARNMPVCVRSVPDPACAAAPPAQLLVSVATSDGSAAAPLGRDDLLDLDAVDPGWVRVLDGDTGTPLAGVFDTRILLSPSGQGTFPTTVLVFDLTVSDAAACDGRGGLRGFRRGDKLVLSHNIRPVVSTLPRALDGDGDGVATELFRDDWVGIWDDGAQTFVPLVRTPRRD